MTPKVFLTRPLPAQVMELLKKEVDLTYNSEDRVLTKKEIIEGVKGKDGLLCLLTDKIDGEVMDASPQLKIIANYAVGYNNIDIPAAQERSLMVTNTPGVLTAATAELAIALILTVGRRLIEADLFAKSAQWQGWGPLQYIGKEIDGSTLGIIGLGRIGKAVAQRALALGMKISYWNRTRLSTKEEEELNVQYLPKKTLLQQADFVSLHLAYHQETHHLIAEEELSLMPKGSFLINTARGAIVKEAALVEALKSGHLAGAGLDVYEKEPKINPELFELPNVVLLPHIGSATLKTRTAMGMLAVKNLLAGLKGQQPPNLVNI